MIDEQPRQIEHSSHPCDDRNDMQGLDPFIHRTRPFLIDDRRPLIAGFGCSHSRDSISTWSFYLPWPRPVRKQLLSKPINFRILGLSLCSGGLKWHKTVRRFPRASSHLSTIAEPRLSNGVTLCVSSRWRPIPQFIKRQIHKTSLTLSLMSGLILAESLVKKKSGYPSLRDTPAFPLR